MEVMEYVEKRHDEKRFAVWFFYLLIIPKPFISMTPYYPFSFTAVKSPL